MGNCYSIYSIKTCSLHSHDDSRFYYSRNSNFYDNVSYIYTLYKQSNKQSNKIKRIKRYTY